MRISITEFIVIVVMLIALVHGVAKFYERVLTNVNQVTAERIRSDR